MHYYQTGVPRYDSVFEGYNQSPAELSFFVNLEFNPNKRISGFIGGRASYYDFGRTVLVPEPRIELKYHLNNASYTGLSYTRMTQPLHQISQNYSELPGDLLIAANASHPPEIADQIAFSWNYQATVEHSIDIGLFYKKYLNLIYLNQNIPVFTGSWEEEEGRFLTGEGESYGLESLYQYSGQKVNGWVSATWSRSFRLFEGLNQSKPFPYRNDRPIYLTTSWIYNINSHINLSAQWFYGSGKPITLPEQKFAFDDTSEELFIYSEKNGYRMKPIHRLDVGVNFSKNKKRGIRTWNVGIINVYNRHNPYYYTMSVIQDRSTQEFSLQVRQWSFFPVTPSVSFRFAFH